MWKFPSCRISGTVCLTYNLLWVISLFYDLLDLLVSAGTHCCGICFAFHQVTWYSISSQSLALPTVWCCFYGLGIVVLYIYESRRCFCSLRLLSTITTFKWLLSGETYFKYFFKILLIRSNGNMRCYVNHISMKEIQHYSSIVPSGDLYQFYNFQKSSNVYRPLSLSNSSLVKLTAVKTSPVSPTD